MPFYEYSCPQCGAEKEVLHGINAQPEVVCEACSAGAMQRLVSAAGFRLKGGGWYETDFKSDKRRNVAGDNDNGSAATGNGSAESSTGGDKPAEKSQDKSSTTAAAGDKSADKPAAKPAGEASSGKGGAASAS